MQAGQKDTKDTPDEYAILGEPAYNKRRMLILRCPACGWAHCAEREAYGRTRMCPTCNTVHPVPAWRQPKADEPA